MKRQILKSKFGRKVLTSMLEGKVEGEITDAVLESALNKMDTTKLNKFMESINSKNFELIKESSDNPIFDEVSKNRPNYVHVIEVEDVEELKSTLDSLCDDFDGKYSPKEIFEFISSLQVYCLDDENCDEVYDYNVDNHLKEVLNLEEVSESTEYVEYSGDDYLRIANAMKRFGGSFIYHIGEALLRADSGNRIKLSNAFSEEFAKYFQMGEKFNESLENDIELYISTTYAPAIINGDYSGLEDEEIKEIETFFEEEFPGHYAIIADDEPEFTKCRISKLDSDCYKVILRQSNN